MFHKQQIPSDSKKFLVFDIGTSRTTIAYCFLEDGFLHVGDFMSCQYPSTVFHFGDIVKSRILLQSLKSLVRDFRSRIGELPEEAYIILNHPSFLTDAMSYSFIREARDEPVSRDELYGYLTHVEGLSLDRIQSQWSLKTPYPASDMRPMYANISSIYIDGSSIPSPIDETGKNIQLNILNCVGSATFLSQISTLFSRCGISISEIVPVGACLLNYIDTTDLFSQVVLDFGYSYTTVCVFDGKMHTDFRVLPVGYSSLEHLLVSSTQLTALEIQDILYNPSNREKYAGDFASYNKMLSCALQVAFEDITLSIASTHISFSGSESHKGIYENMLDGTLSPWIIRDASLTAVSEKPTDKIIATDRRSLTNIIGFLQGKMQTKPIDPISHMLRDIVSSYE